MAAARWKQLEAVEVQEEAEVVEVAAAGIPPKLDCNQFPPN